MKRLLSILILATAVAVTGSADDVIPTPFACTFSDPASTFNGEPLPVGSVIEAFDPDGVLCGRFVVTTAGAYGFMPVYGDDDFTTDVDEGAEDGDTITFTINGRVATTTGTTTWVDREFRSVQLSASGTAALTALVLPVAKAGTFDDTVRFEIELRNDGNINDKLIVTADADNPNFIQLPTDDFPVDSGVTATVYFDIETPTFLGGGDTVITISYQVQSRFDTTVTITGDVQLFFTVTDVDDPFTGLPTAFALYQNYPNPFNPTTTIAFSLDERADVTIEIYNVLGQSVERFDLGLRPAGEHEIEWNARNRPSGVYFYRLSSELGSQVRKMVLLK